MIQLKAYQGSTQYFIDLYETEPIKLNLSIEDITDTGARSTFSRNFRVPATRANNAFFKHAFLIEGIDYDVTVKKPAEILVDGAEFRKGHIRLQSIYVNGDQDNIDYEIIFLGETRDFSSELKDKTLADLDLSAYNHDLTYLNVTNSWQAYPQGGLTDGLFNGDVLYPLVDHGNIYQGVLTDARIEYTNNTSEKGFNFQQNAIQPNRLKPMFRMSTLFRKIFSEAGFTIISNFLDSNICRNMYVSAWGNVTNITELDGSANFLDVRLTADQFGSSDILWDDVILDPSGNYNPAIGTYFVPNTGQYRILSQVEGVTRNDGTGGTLTVELLVNGSVVASDINGIPSLAPGTFYPWATYFDVTLNLNGPLPGPQDNVKIRTIEAGNVSGTVIDHTTSYFTIPEAPGPVNISTQFDEKYKQIDFVKDILTKFRLVMAPTNNQNEFIIEPWVEYIGSGDLYDWTNKVDRTKDIQIEPLFFTQANTLNFSDRADADYLNDFNIRQFKETFGTLRFESGNELLVGSREIKTQMAPTPITQIEGALDSNFILPLCHLHNTTDTGIQTHNSIKAVTRLLFYNGLITQTKQTAWPSNNQEWWMLDDAANPQPQTQYPRVTMWSVFEGPAAPPANALNLSWQIERGYANPYPNYNFLAGNSVYTIYWDAYISSIYNKYARKVTLYVILDNVDLNNFTFDDVIFIDGVYYRPEKIVDVIVGEKSSVKVELIKLLNYNPAFEFAEEAPGGGTELA
jgi:hypothetical protein